MNLSDHDLLTRCRAADEAAWYELVRRYTKKVFAIAYRFTGRAAEAEDLTQEVFVKVHQNLHRYRSGGAAFSTWLSTVARNHVIDDYRRRRDERRTEDPEILELTPSREDGPLRTLERTETARLVHRGLQALPRNLRVPLVLCDLQGLSYEEAADTLGIPLGTVKSRINRGRLELARRLARRRDGAGPRAL